MPMVPSLVVGTVGVLFVVAAPTPLDIAADAVVVLDADPTSRLLTCTPHSTRCPRHRRSSAAAISNDLNRTATFQTPSGHLTSLLPPFPNPPRRQYPSKSLRRRHWSYQRIAYPMLLQNRATDLNMAADPLRRFKPRSQLQLRLSVANGLQTLTTPYTATQYCEFNTSRMRVRVTRNATLTTFVDSFHSCSFRYYDPFKSPDFNQVNAIRLIIDFGLWKLKLESFVSSISINVLESCFKFNACLVRSTYKYIHTYFNSVLGLHSGAMMIIDSRSRDYPFRGSRLLSTLGLTQGLGRNRSCYSSIYRCIGTLIKIGVRPPAHVQTVPKLSSTWTIAASQ
ncbi:hypothetical protein C8R43DRAFT_1153672 [Mycena crocata]|nr:hypothetical protein C8R43DRAFT_1137412 [Mycena crocata]KAJ7118492.1 hypothetical protein C8R43DRAFT_1153672 [Mycena crocata]